MTTLTGGVGENVVGGNTSGGINLADLLASLGDSPLIPGGVENNELIQNYDSGADVTNYYTPIQDNRSVAVAKGPSVVPGLKTSPISTSQTAPLTGGVNDSEFKPSSVELGPALRINIPQLGSAQNQAPQGMLSIGGKNYPAGAVTASASNQIPAGVPSRIQQSQQPKLNLVSQQPVLDRRALVRQTPRQAPLSTPRPAEDISADTIPLAPPIQRRRRSINPIQQAYANVPKHVGGGYSANPAESDRLNKYRQLHADIVNENLKTLQPVAIEQPVDPRSYDWKIRARAALDPSFRRSIDAQMKQKWDAFNKRVKERQLEVRQAKTNLASLANTGLTQEAQISKKEYSAAYDMAQKVMEKGMPSISQYNLMARWVTESYPPGKQRDKAIAGIYQGSYGMLNLSPVKDVPQPEIKTARLDSVHIGNQRTRQNIDFHKEADPLTIKGKKIANKNDQTRGSILAGSANAQVAIKKIQSGMMRKKLELLNKYGDKQYQLKFDKFKLQNKKTILANLKTQEQSLRAVQTRYDKLSENFMLEGFLSSTSAQKARQLEKNPELARLAEEYMSLGEQLESAQEGLDEIRQIRSELAKVDLSQSGAYDTANSSMLRRRRKALDSSNKTIKRRRVQLSDKLNIPKKIGRKRSLG